MVHALQQKVLQKNWEPEYLEKTIKVLQRAENSKGSVITKLDKFVYWAAILIAVTGNFIISIIIIPFLITITNKIALGFIIFTISLSFGFMFNVLLKDIGELDHDSHIMAGLFIPCLGLLNMYVITTVANHFIRILNIQDAHNPFIIGFIYVTAFVIPYFLDKIFKEKTYASKNKSLIY